MWTLLLVVTLSQAPAAPTVALLERPAPAGEISRERMDAVEGAVRAALEEAKAPVAFSPEEVKERLQGTEAEGCVKGLECLFRVAQALHADAVVSVQATQVADDVAVSLEAAGHERRLAKTSFVVKAPELQEGLGPQLRPFAEQLAAALREVPRITAGLTPRPQPQALSPEVVQAPPSPLPRYLATGGAVAAGGTAVALLLTGLTHQDHALETTSPDSNRSVRTYPAAQREAELANRNFGWAIASGAATAALTATAVWLWQR